jgi:hypothetical protein
MEHGNKTNAIEKDTLVLVLNEFAEEQINLKSDLHNLSISIDSLANKINVLESKMNEHNLNQSGVSLSHELYIRGRLKELKSMLDNQPKSIVRKYQLLLFPERDAHLFYKVVFGRWYLVLLLMVFITRLYSFGIHWADNNRAVGIEQERNIVFRKAWINLYEKKGKSGKLEMDSIFMKMNK